jgi:hypothetical protein
VENKSALIFLFVLACGILLRAWYWHETDLTLEDAFVTYRYAENIAAGKGFVYNECERVLGTTTPLWTLILGTAKAVGLDPIPASKVLGILFDCVSLLLMAAILYEISPFGAMIWPLMYGTSPSIIPITVSGLETSLLILCMSLALWGYIRKNPIFSVALALLLLTRVDGLLCAGILSGIGLMQDRRWMSRQLVIALILLLPWCVFSLLYFGDVLPQSLYAKRAAYQLGFTVSAAPFLYQFTPVGETHPVEFVLKCALSVLLIIGLAVTMRRRASLLPLAVFFPVYTLAFMLSGVPIFSWYAVPAVFASYAILSMAFDWIIGRVKARAKHAVVATVMQVLIVLGVCGAHLSALPGRMEKHRQLQESEQHLRKQIGLWLADTAEPGSRIFLEPIGYVGYYAGPGLTVYDEIGLVTPEVLELRKSGPCWYVNALRSLKPDYVLQYAYSLEKNLAEGTDEELFCNEEDRYWFGNNFHRTKVFDITDKYPLVQDKEKKYVLFQSAHR